MKDLKNQANQVANAGRYGDSMLVHMNPIEVQSLANTMPMTVNPQTGQPEMFLPFLAPILGSVAGTSLLGGLSGISPALAGAIGSGVTTAIAEGDLKQGILAGISGFGIGDVLGKVGSGAAQQAEKALAESLKQQASSNVASATAIAEEAARKATQDKLLDFKNLTAGERLGQIGQNIFSGETLQQLSKPTSYLPIALGEGQRGVIQAQEEFQEDMRRLREDEEERIRKLYENNPEQIPFGSPFFGMYGGGLTALSQGGDLEEALRMPPAPTRNIPMPQPAPVLDNSFESALAGNLDFLYMEPPMNRLEPFIPASEVMAQNVSGEMQGTGQFIPPSNYQPGIDPEFNYFPFSNRPATDIQNNTGGLGIGSFVRSVYPDMRDIDVTELDIYDPAMASRYRRAGTLDQYINLLQEQEMDNINKFIADLEGSDRNEMSKGKSIDDLTRGALIHELQEGKEIPDDNKGLQALAKEAPDVVRKMGFDFQMGGMTVAPEDLDMVQKAILGQIPNNAEVISMFIDKYGNDIFMQIREQVLNPMGSMQTQGMIEGMGGGMDDQVMGMIGTQQPVAVSPGEYIIPADVVSGLGDGSSDAGSKELDMMLDRVRQERTNTTKQPDELNKNKVLPA